MTLSQTTTRDAADAVPDTAASNDPELLTRSKVRLLQNTSKMPKHGLGEAGRFVLPDENLLMSHRSGARHSRHPVFNLGRTHLRQQSYWARALRFAV